MQVGGGLWIIPEHISEPVEVILASKVVTLCALTCVVRYRKISNRGICMSEQTAAQREMAELLVESLNLEDLPAEEIDPHAALFGDGLGLDSIDALEIALAISQKYGVQMQAEDENTRNAFATLASLCVFVERNSS